MGIGTVAQLFANIFALLHNYSQMEKKGMSTSCRKKRGKEQRWIITHREEKTCVKQLKEEEREGKKMHTTTI